MLENVATSAGHHNLLELAQDCSHLAQACHKKAPSQQEWLCDTKLANVGRVGFVQ